MTNSLEIIQLSIEPRAARALRSKKDAKLSLDRPIAGGTPKAKRMSNFQEDAERQGWRQIGRIASNRLEGAGKPQERQAAKLVTHDRQATRRELSDQSDSLEHPVTRRQPRSHERPQKPGGCRVARMAPSSQESAEW